MQDNEIKKGLSPLEKKTEENPSSEKEDIELLAPIVKRNPPKTFKIGRMFFEKYSHIENEIFQLVNKKEVNFSAGTLIAFAISVGQKLYEDSFATGRATGKEPLNIGRALTPDGDIPLDITNKYMQENGFGIENEGNAHIKELEELINFLHCHPLFCLDRTNSGEGENLVLIKKWRVKEGKMIGYRLYINKIFSDFADGYGKAVRGIMKKLVNRLGRKITPIHRKLVLYFMMQDKRKPHTISLENLIQYLGKWDEYKEQKSRVINSLRSAFDIFKEKDINILEDYELTDSYNLKFYFPSKKKELPKDKKE